jgi:hypothetical protein
MWLGEAKGVEKLGKDDERKLGEKLTEVCVCRGFWTEERREDDGSESNAEDAAVV